MINAILVMLLFGVAVDPPPGEAGATVRRLLAAVQAGNINLALREVDDAPADQRLFRLAIELDLVGAKVFRRTVQFDRASATLTSFFGPFERSQLHPLAGQPDRFLAMTDDDKRLVVVARSGAGRWVLVSDELRDFEAYPGQAEHWLATQLVRYRLLLGLLDHGIAHDAGSTVDWLALTAPLASGRARPAETELRSKLSMALDPLRFGLPEMTVDRLKGSDRAVELVKSIMTSLAEVRRRADEVDLTDAAAVERLRQLLLHHPRPVPELGKRVGTLDEATHIVINVDGIQALEYDKRSGFVLKLDADYALKACFGGVTDAETVDAELRRILLVND